MLAGLRCSMGRMLLCVSEESADDTSDVLRPGLHSVYALHLMPHQTPDDLRPPQMVVDVVLQDDLLAGRPSWDDACGQNTCRKMHARSDRGGVLQQHRGQLVVEVVALGWLEVVVDRGGTRSVVVVVARSLPLLEQIRAEMRLPQQLRLLLLRQGRGRQLRPFLRKKVHARETPSGAFFIFWGVGRLTLFSLFQFFHSSYTKK
mmetsp:Transcript_18677/g.46645  ORF Transcript_18677/g.46645 Transcript_18677/m.46645 type:complete len:203 (-) Transcript_18677:77-685(-)